MRSTGHSRKELSIADDDVTERSLIMTRTPIFTTAVILSLGMIPAAYGVEPESDQVQLSQPAKSEQGSVSDQESTNKQRNPDKSQKADQNAQVTLGGAKSVVSGEIWKIEGEYYFIKDDEDGGEVRLLVNQDANLDCSSAPSAATGITSPKAAPERQPGEATTETSGRQKEQGQKKDETAVGSGFSIGTCSFKPGDRIRAEVDDMGRVTTLKLTPTRMPQTARSLGESAGTGELAMPGKQETPGQLDMTGPQGYPPKEYAISPVPHGELKSVTENPLVNSGVKDAEGKSIGSLDSLLMDAHTGQIEYAVVLMDDSKRLEAVPWAHMKKAPEPAKQEFILDTKHFQLSPSGATKDRSPQVQKLIEDRQVSVKLHGQIHRRAFAKPNNTRSNVTSIPI